MEPFRFCWACQKRKLPVIVVFQLQTSATHACEGELTFHAYYKITFFILLHPIWFVHFWVVDFLNRIVKKLVILDNGNASIVQKCCLMQEN